MANYPFHNVSKIGEPLISDNIEANLTAYYNWNLLGINAFGNVHYSTSGSHGGLASRLRPATNESYDDGQVWESFRKQWIWQSGVYADSQPIQISGVKVNGVFRPSSGVGPYAHIIDYPNGRVIFDSAIPTTATVLCEFSFNYFQIYTPDNPWWSELQRNSFRIDDNSFLTSASGYMWSIPPEKRVQLPALIIEATTNIQKRPYELGSHNHWHKQEVKIHILTETRQDLKFISDVIGNQYNVVMNMFDKADMIMSGVYPINLADGSLNPGIQNYPDVLANFPANKEMQFVDLRSIEPGTFLYERLEQRNIPFYYSIIRTNVETLLGS